MCKHPNALVFVLARVCFHVAIFSLVLKNYRVDGVRARGAPGSLNL